MATAAGQEVTLLATYCGKRLSLTVPTKVKVGDVVQKAAETLNLKSEDLPLSLLYQGSPIDDTAPLDMALAKMKGVTAIHLVKRSKTGQTTRVISVTEGVLYAYCSICEGLSKIRPIFKCSSCKEEGAFERKSTDRIDHFDGQYPTELIRGTCNQCKASDVLPDISFQCVACDEKNQAILRQIRDNVHDIPCMKCSLRQEIVVQMRCSSRHCICLSCFRNMCTVKLDNDSFRNFVEFGYSVSCPGPGTDCKDVPILDPHHFKIVDEDPKRNGAFYGRFKDKSAAHYRPSGDDIMCVCKKEIAMSSAHSVPSEPAKQETQPTVAGQKWYSSWMSIFKKKQEPAPPPGPRKTRRRASCANCNTEYCMECKMVWHTGDCPTVDDKDLKEQEFPIQADLARSAQWPSK